ncbi:hypothetical protein ABZ259_32350, partial [Streptomyces cyaneofuscatus]
PLKDPLAYGRTTALPLPEPILGHSDYQADPVCARARRRSAPGEGPEAAGGSTGAPAGPRRRPRGGPRPSSPGPGRRRGAGSAAGPSPTRAR